MNQTAADRTIEELYAPGRDIGQSSWIQISQNMISNFGETTLDPDPMHVDPEWSSEHSPYSGTIAFGFLTSSLLTHMLHSAMGSSNGWDSSTDGYLLNYGMDYLRFLNPVTVNSQIRGRFKSLGYRLDKKGRYVVKIACEVEIEGEERPALVAEWLTIYMPYDADQQGVYHH